MKNKKIELKWKIIFLFSPFYFLFIFQWIIWSRYNFFSFQYLFLNINKFFFYFHFFEIMQMKKNLNYFNKPIFFNQFEISHVLRSTEQNFYIPIITSESSIRIITLIKSIFLSSFIIPKAWLIMKKNIYSRYRNLGKTHTPYEVSN